MDFGAYFRLMSYATIAAAAFALVLAGGVNVWLAGLFAVLMVIAWKFERTRWQLTERMALVVILISILFLSAVKLLQRKRDRDWFFLYLISFFTVLLAAGLTASPLFLAALIVYLLCALSTVVAF